MTTEGRSVVCGIGGGEGDWEEARELLGVMEVFFILITM